MFRSHNCNELTLKDENKEVLLSGWVNSRRDHGGLIFIDLRDRYGLTQVVFDPQINAQVHDQAQILRNEFVISVKGKVTKRPQGTVNPKLITGEIEVHVENLEILNKAEPLPFDINDEREVNEELRLKYRFLDLRKKRMKENLILRSKVFKVIRDFMDQENFTEIETPILTKSTPEGARDYLVPSRVNTGSFFALPQSPQLFKQILMVSGFDKYYQIAKCFRDEDLRKDRQPEFTQLDIEMSFISEDEIYALMEKLIARIFLETQDKIIPIPFKRLTYKQSMENYGTDKPDLRYEMCLHDLSDFVRESEFMVFKNVIAAQGKVLGIKAAGANKFSAKDLDDLTQKAKDLGAKGLVWIKINAQDYQSPVKKHLGAELLGVLSKKFEAQEGDLLLIVADQADVAFTVLGGIRAAVAEKMEWDRDNSQLKFVWITDFPLFQYNKEEKRWDSEHHPFTAPKPEDIRYLDSDLSHVRSCAYDLVVNGTELGSGSIRIHQQALQEKIFQILGMNPEEVKQKFGFLLDAFKFGAPPHGGIAPGLDRLLTIMTNSASIRDVIAFPKTQKAWCPLTDAPSKVSNKQLEELSLTIKQE